MVRVSYSASSPSQVKGRAGQLDNLILYCQGMIDLKGLYRINPETGKFDRTLVSLPPPQVDAASCQAPDNFEFGACSL